MRIQLLGGGLGNQIWHYSFLRFAERNNPTETWMFDDTNFYVDDFNYGEKTDFHNGYELENVFGIKANLLSNLYTVSKWKDIIDKRRKGKTLPEILLGMGENYVLFEGMPSILQTPFSGKIVRPESPLGFHPEYTILPYKNIYYHANWADKRWFMAYREENLRELHFPGLEDEQNRKYAKSIQKSYSVGIHVRRGDFLKIKLSLPTEVYRTVCLDVLQKFPFCSFFVFSDDLDWCYANEKELGFNLAESTTYISGNTGKNSYIDMQLLSMCKGIVRNSMSSFSQVAGWLNPNLEFEIKIKPEAGHSYKIVTY